MTAEPSQPPTGAADVDLSGTTLLGNYRVERRLADGGMGSIYLGHDVSLDRPVVVKVPHPRFLGEPGFLQRFDREVAGLVRLEHPHVVRILARGSHRGVPFLVLQYLGGGSLDDRLARAPGGRQGPLEVATWLRPLAGTLDAVHARGFLHRDVKPGNVLFDEAGHVFLSDFGVAKALESEDPGVTQPGSGIGSPRYMAPEQALGSTVGPAADQYALASCVYQALAGVPPFEGQQAVEVMVRKTKEEAPSLAARAGGLPDPACGAVMRALARDPATRFPSCSAFADAFLLGLGVTPVGASTQDRTPTPWAATVRSPSGRRILVGGGVAALALAALAVLLLRDGRPAAPPPAPPPVPVVGVPREGTQVLLTDPGKGERSRLRYHVASGARDRVRVVLGVTAHLIGGPVRAPIEEDEVAFDGELVIERVEEGTGLIHYAFRILALDERQPPKAAVPRLHKIDREALAHVVGLEARGVADDRGRTRPVAFQAPPGLSEAATAALEGITLALGDAFTPLPEEPVGVGARWQVSEVEDRDGLWMTKAVRYELVEREGWVLRLRTQGVGASPGGEIGAPAIAGIEARVTGLTMTTQGEIVQHLYELAPQSIRTEGLATLSTSMSSEGGKGALAVTLEMRNVTSLTRVPGSGS